jgi:protein phosphatase
MPLKSGTLDAYGTTHVGRVRHVNQDQFLIASLLKFVEIEQTSLKGTEDWEIASPGRAALMMVADGVGGLAAGEKASEAALENVAQYVAQAMRCYYTAGDDAEEQFIEELRSAVMRTDAAVVHEAEGDPEREGMATAAATCSGPANWRRSLATRPSRRTWSIKAP